MIIWIKRKVFDEIRASGKEKQRIRVTEKDWEAYGLNSFWDQNGQSRELVFGVINYVTVCVYI